MYDPHQYDEEGHCHRCGDITIFAWADQVREGQLVPGWACQKCGAFAYTINRVTANNYCTGCGNHVRSTSEIAYVD